MSSDIKASLPPQHPRVADDRRESVSLQKSIPLLLQRALPGLKAPINARAIEELAGSSNRVFSVKAGRERFVIRFSRSDRTPAEQVSEDMALREAWRLDLGAEVIWTDMDAGILVTRWLEGAEPQCDAALGTDPALLEKVVTTIATYHRGGASVPKCLDLDALGTAFVKSLEIRGAVDASASELTILISAAAARLSRQMRLVPSHCDLSPGNILRARGQIRLIDWEYAAMAPPAWDLGYFMVEACLDATWQIAPVLAAYGDPRICRADILAAMLLAGIQNALWFERSCADQDASCPSISLVRRWRQVEQIAKALAAA